MNIKPWITLAEMVVKEYASSQLKKWFSIVAVENNWKNHDMCLITNLLTHMYASAATELINKTGSSTNFFPSLLMMTLSVFIADNTFLFILVLGQPDQKMILPIKCFIWAYLHLPSSLIIIIWLFPSFSKCENEEASLNCFDR